jgi:hypothetical protein
MSGAEETKPQPAEACVNTPKLIGIAPSWGYVVPSGMALIRALPAFIRYRRKYGPYFVPESYEAWGYRRALRHLDPACLHALRLQGALANAELTEWLNRDGALRLASDKTGINCITPGTTGDWIELALRRGLITRWDEAEDVSSGPDGSRATRWILTERGREELLTPVQKFAKNVSIPQLVSVLIGGSAAFAWIGSNGIVLAVVLYAAFLGIYALALLLFMHRKLRREGPGGAVVAIETLRDGGEPLPSLGEPQAAIENEPCEPTQP